MTEGNFFHSKLSLAEKLAEKHTRDLVKHGLDTGNMTPTTSVNEQDVSGRLLNTLHEISFKSLLICVFFYKGWQTINEAEEEQSTPVLSDHDQQDGRQ